MPRPHLRPGLRGDRDRRRFDGRHRTPGPRRRRPGLPLPVNLGQGRALRLGYRLARASAAPSLIATLDADGQFDPGELPTLVAPLDAGEADFVNGSRRLGRAEKADAVRQIGRGRFRRSGDAS